MTSARCQKRARWKARSAATYNGVAAERKKLVTRAAKLRKKEADNAATATDYRRRLEKAATAVGFVLDGYVITEVAGAEAAGRRAAAAAAREAALSGRPGAAAAAAPAAVVAAAAVADPSICMVHASYRGPGFRPDHST
eukprot:COSAG01_NODE_4579_length_4904_cov_13.838710_5_plen_139_part_00